MEQEVGLDLIGSKRNVGARVFSDARRSLWTLLRRTLFGEVWLSITRNNQPSRLTGKIRDGYILTNLVVVQFGQDLTWSLPKIIGRRVQDQQVI